MDASQYKDYQHYLEEIVQLTKKLKNGPGAAAYPAKLNTAAKRSLYDNLGKDEALALTVDAAVRENRQDEWRDNVFKVKRVRNAIKAALQDKDGLTEQVLELVKQQNEY